MSKQSMLDMVARMQEATDKDQETRQKADAEDDKFSSFGSFSSNGSLRFSHHISPKLGSGAYQPDSIQENEGSEPSDYDE